MKEGSTERRAHARFETTLELEAQPSAGELARMVASNLSEGGLHCTSRVGFPEMTRLAVRLMLPPERGGQQPPQPLDLEAVVVRSNASTSVNGDERHELALFFTKLGENERARITRYLSG